MDLGVNTFLFNFIDDEKVNGILEEGPMECFRVCAKLTKVDPRDSAA